VFLLAWKLEVRVEVGLLVGVMAVEVGVMVVERTKVVGYPAAAGVFGLAQV
jgi:hypothetical protein